MPPALLLSARSRLHWLCRGYDNAFNNMVLSLGLYFLQKQSGGIFFPLPLPGKCWVVFTAKQNSPFPDKLLSAWGNALIFSITSTARVEALDKKKKRKKRKRKKKKERKKRINAQVGYLAGRIHLEWASNCCSLTRQCLKPGLWMNIFANILHDFTVEGLQQMQTQ